MKKILCLILFAGMIFPSLALPQPEWRQARKKEMMRQRLEKAKDARDMIEDLRIVRMTKEIALHAQQLAKLLPRWREMQDARKEFQGKRMRLIKDMDDLLNAKAPEKDLQAKLAEMEKLEGDFQSKEREGRKEMLGQLSVEQKARFFVFQEKFEREVRELIRGIKGGGQPGMGPGMGPPPNPGP